MKEFHRIFRDGVLIETIEVDVPDPSPEDYAREIQAHVDATARARGYGDGFALASYVASTVAAWQAEAQAFVAWRDAVWLYAYQQLQAVQSGVRPAPEIPALVAELPAIEWPD